MLTCSVLICQVFCAALAQRGVCYVDARPHRNAIGDRGQRADRRQWRRLPFPHSRPWFYLTDLLPGLVVMSIGLGALLVAVTTGATAGVPAEKAGFAAALLNASQQLGGALGLAIFAAIATSHTSHLLAARTVLPAALTAGFQRALLASSVSLVAAAVIATRTVAREANRTKTSWYYSRSLRCGPAWLRDLRRPPRQPSGCDTGR